MKPDILYDSERLCVVFCTFIAFPNSNNNLFELFYYFHGKPYIRIATSFPQSWKCFAPTELTEAERLRYMLKFATMSR